jgi:Leucine-rich repeat (LRR) protein
MDCDCQFSIILKCMITDICNYLLINKFTYQLNREYLWELLYHRNYTDNNILITNESYIFKYKLIDSINKVKNKLNLKNKLNELYLLTIINLERKKLSSIPSELGNLTNLQRLDLDYNATAGGGAR